MERQRRYAASRPCRPTSSEPIEHHARSGWNLEHREGGAAEDRTMGNVRIGDTAMNSRTRVRIGVVVPFSNTNLESDVILYGCTSATISAGREFDIEFSQSIQRQCGAPAITAAGALVEALGNLGVKRLGFCSPYVESLNRMAMAFLQSSGFEIVSSAYVGEDLGNYGQGALTPEE